jgi:Ca-activated chloride channel family protein
LIFTVGVGEESGAPIPVNRGGRADYIRDATGAVVSTRLDPSTLEDVARSGGGAYFTLSSDASSLVMALRDRIDTIEKREYEQRVFTDYESYFQIFIGLSLLILLIEFMLSYRVSRLKPKRNYLDI